FYLTAAEREGVLAQPRGDAPLAPRDRLAVLLWALKEAAFKAIQPPRGLGLLDVEVDLPGAWDAPRGRATVRYRRAAAERYVALGAGPIHAGWRRPEPDLVVAWVLVQDAPLPAADLG
ncbi:MAG: 4'-phosphopantetheinyl transferase superfamily protein, partial [Planctomycetes bacterium]|nr:4'-phosphopantetheinyl transferase superfamily protein [Planctomycetota bacterium]